ncbi:MAG: phenylalanine--tRNA ligase subunit beta, partial [Chitinophagaceae bacterium]
MKISHTWLCDYLPKKINPEKLSSILTTIGLEVENIEHYKSVKGGLKELIIGEILSIENIPNANKIRLTQVKINPHEVLQIVCGATNIVIG